MKTALCALLPLLCLSALAQPNSSEPAGQGATPSEMWRCGKIYTNSPPAGDKSCVKLAMRTPKERQDYLACQSEASKAPTELGVRVALGVCKQRFGE